MSRIDKAEARKQGLLDICSRTQELSTTHILSQADIGYNAGRHALMCLTRAGYLKRQIVQKIAYYTKLEDVYIPVERDAAVKVERRWGFVPCRFCPPAIEHDVPDDYKQSIDPNSLDFYAKSQAQSEQMRRERKRDKVDVSGSTLSQF